VNWNILVASGKEIKRDSMISVNESRAAYKNIRIYIWCIYIVIFFKHKEKVVLE